MNRLTAAALMPLVILLWGILWFRLLAPRAWSGQPNSRVTVAVYAVTLLPLWIATYRLAHR